MGYSVLDLDYQSGAADSFANLKQLHDTHSLDNVLSVNTPNGIHLYVDNQGLKNTASVIGDGMDIRSEGGFIMAPRSVHRSNKLYQWNLISDIGTIPEDWVYEAESVTGVRKGLRGKGEKNPSSSLKLKDIVLPRELSSNYVITKGKRNSTLFKWACRERGKGADAHLIYDSLVAIRDTFCDGADDITDVELNNMANRVAAEYPTNAQKLADSRC